MTDPAEFFDARAERWEENCYPPPVRERLASLIPEFGVRAGERVLDLGTGPGVLIPYLLSRIGQRGRLCAIDISFQMTRKARLKIPDGRHPVIRADAHAIPLRCGIFDRVICFAAFPHFSDGLLALKEMARVSRTGAAVIVAHLMSRSELAAHHATHSAVARDVLPDEEGMRALFASAGLAVVDLMDVPGRYLVQGIKMPA